MKALVVYGTKSGCTAGIAEKIGEALSARGQRQGRRDGARDRGNGERLDAVVVGSGVEPARGTNPFGSGSPSNAESAQEKPVAFFTCGLTITDASKADEVHAYTDALITETRIHPVDVGLFAGWNEPSKFGLLERTVLKALKAPTGDLRDLDAVAEWTEGIASQLAGG